MREEETDWFKRMQARTRKTVKKDSIFVLLMIGALALICAAMCIAIR